MTAQTIEQLVEQLNTDPNATLDPFAYFLLKDHISSLNKRIKEYETGRDALKSQTQEGQIFVYRGQGYTVVKMRTNTNWRQAYAVAHSMLGSAERQAVEETVAAELVSDVFKCEPVYHA